MVCASYIIGVSLFVIGCRKQKKYIKNVIYEKILLLRSKQNAEITSDVKMDKMLLSICSKSMLFSPTRLC